MATKPPRVPHLGETGLVPTSALYGSMVLEDVPTLTRPGYGKYMVNIWLIHG